ncbi:MAG: metal ABC transporter ATP-binding protein [Chloroflexi bacterium]|nr:metal ABC transporter ATP-binding protein [Chloroflexota bacterium]
MTTPPQPNSSTPALEVRGLWAGYNHTPALKDVSFQVPEGEIVGIIGPNGAGKSTLFKAILDLMKPWRGETLIFGQSNRSQRAKIGYMPQIELVDWNFPVSVKEVVLMGRYGHIGLFRRPSKEDRAAAHEALEQVGMAHLGDRLIGELSGGQRRRVLLARALTNRPKLLLLDEPMAGLDATVQHQIISILRALRDSGTTVVLSTHDLSCVSAACDLTLCLNCQVVAYGPPRDVLVEKVLGETFGTHLLMVHLDGQAYAYQHHRHSNGPPNEDK